MASEKRGLLILDRRRGEAIVVAEVLEVTVDEVRRDSVTLTFSGPSGVEVGKSRVTDKPAEKTLFVGKEVEVGDGVIFALLEVEGGKARVGVHAPPNVPVDRKEVHERKMREKHGDQDRVD